MQIFDLAIIGGGACGIRLAQLKAASDTCVVFEKSRGIGGRLASRRVQLDATLLQVDLGAVFFTKPWHSEALCRWQTQNLLQEWQLGPQVSQASSVIAKDSPAIAPGLSKDLLKRILPEQTTLACQTRIQALAFDVQNQYWILTDANDTQWRARRCTLAMPAPQASALLATCEQQSVLIKQLEAVIMAPRWTWVVVAQGEQPCRQHWLAQSHDWVDYCVLASQKPGNPWPAGVNAFVVQSKLAWSEQHVEWTTLAMLEQYESSLITGLQHFYGQASLNQVHCVQAHKWRYGHAVKPLGRPWLGDLERGLVCGGDWALGYGVDAALRSAEAMTAALEHNA